MVGNRVGRVQVGVKACRIQWISYTPYSAASHSWCEACVNVINHDLLYNFHLHINVTNRYSHLPHHRSRDFLGSTSKEPRRT